MRKAGIVSIGNELLSGDIINKDLGIIARILKKYGLEVVKEITVKDDEEAIIEAIKFLIPESDLIILTGGLGPTPDDRTRSAIAGFLGRALRFDEELYKKALKRLEDYNIEIREIHKAYGIVPETCEPIENPTGVASGYLCRFKDVVILSLPGPPRELEPTLENALKKLGLERAEVQRLERIYKTFGIAETDIQEWIKPLKERFKGVEFGFYPSLYGVKLKISLSDRAVFEEVDREIRRILGINIYGIDEETLPQVLGKLLKDKGWTISVAESCTGGLVGDLITSVSGSSEYFIGDVVAYANEVKVEVLKCNEEDLKRVGAVSQEIAYQMAKGVMELMNTDIGISTTGIAGPTGGTPTKPVGLVYMGYVDKKGRSKVIKKIFKGNRAEVKMQAAYTVLDLTRRMLNNEE